MKQVVATSSWLRVDDPEAARIMTDVEARRFLEPFIGQEQTISEVAAKLQVHMSSVLYRVRQFTRLGLLTARSEPRKGRPINHYRSVADGFFVPFEATPLMTEEYLSPHTFSKLQQTLNESVGRAWMKAAGQQPKLGLHLYRNENGFLNQNIVPDPDVKQPERFFDLLLEPDAPAVWDSWGLLQLTQQDAKELQSEIALLLGRYYPKAVTERGTEYIVRLAMAPQTG